MFLNHWELIMTKPMLASDANMQKIKYPCIIQPKIDGVRGLYITDKLTGRSLKQQKNRYTNKFFDDEIFKGFDGELIVNRDPTHPDLCRNTSSVMSRYEGEPHITWCLFDYITEDNINQTYESRYLDLKCKISDLEETHPELMDHLQVVPFILVNNQEELLAWEETWLMQGYEGLIIRDPAGLYKEGRSTAKEGGLLRIKRFKDAEAIVISLNEGEENNNEKQTNELGNSFRTSHQENKASNGMIGNMICEIYEDVIDDISKEVIFEKGFVITVSPGKMIHSDRIYYYENQNLIVGEIIKFKFFAKGIKDKPRFANFQSFRSSEDL